MLLHLSTWSEVETYLKQSQSIIIPIGSTEQHGSMGLIGTDAICAEAVARGVGDAAKAFVAPTLNIGMALRHTGFPGTISLRPTTLITVVEDYLICLAKSGFTRFFFINGHSGNIATLKAAFAQFYYRCLELNLTRATETRCHLANWFMCRSVSKLAQELYSQEEGSHVTPSEIALTQYIYPEAIKNAPLSPEVASGNPIYNAADFRRSYPDGRIGSNPALVTPEHGKQFYKLAVQELSESYLKFAHENSDFRT